MRCVSFMAMKKIMISNKNKRKCQINKTGILIRNPDFRSPSHSLQVSCNRIP